MRAKYKVGDRVRNRRRVFADPTVLAGQLGVIENIETYRGYPARYYVRFSDIPLPSDLFRRAGTFASRLLWVDEDNLEKAREANPMQRQHNPGLSTLATWKTWQTMLREQYGPDVITQQYRNDPFIWHAYIKGKDSPRPVIVGSYDAKNHSFVVKPREHNPRRDRSRSRSRSRKRNPLNVRKLFYVVTSRTNHGRVLYLEKHGKLTARPTAARKFPDVRHAVHGAQAALRHRPALRAYRFDVRLSY